MMTAMSTGWLAVAAAIAGGRPSSGREASWRSGRRHLRPFTAKGGSAALGGTPENSAPARSSGDLLPPPPPGRGTPASSLIQQQGGQRRARFQGLASAATAEARPQASQEVHEEEEEQHENHHVAHVLPAPLLHHDLQMAHGAFQQVARLVEVGHHVLQDAVRLLRLSADAPREVLQLRHLVAHHRDLGVVRLLQQLSGLRRAGVASPEGVGSPPPSAPEERRALFVRGRVLVYVKPI
mmetsp:Transcript_127268/g.360174  ORF Transcript_127268/g.360174 Transcript_127268/m.360174 type:complete len:238 (-) Transcript_127268:119-832(-)